MATIPAPQANWYTNSYGGPFRSARLRAPSLIPSARVSSVPVQQTLVVDAQRRNEGPKENEVQNVRRRETIFGPDVGEDDEPGWTKPDEGAKVDVDTVKGWVDRAKSEEGVHATTTLQALVNLKRPSLLLQQLERDRDNSEVSTTTTTTRRDSLNAPLHTIKFNYDATTPLVNITLSVYPTPPPPIAPVEGKDAPSIVEEDPKVIYSGVHDGGFNKVFQLPTNYSLDLSTAIAPVPEPNDDVSKHSIENTMAELRIAQQPDLADVPEVSAQTVGEPAPAPAPGRRRFGLFRRGQQQADVEAGQIELENRNQQQQQQQEEAQNEKEKEELKAPEAGMRLLIRIDSLGPDGQPLSRRNSQLTHILITGMWVPDAGSTNPTQEGKRVWVIKVARREAIIGAHTFLLKEIYGLSSQSTATSYPPAADDPYASTPNECIVCLSSPRDVVLLPCRHLVVCRDCAVGMIEFGAGGKVARREDGTPAAAETADATPGASGSASAPAPPVVAGGTTTTGRERRKKKAKGWYCPVCRQPYTSLLRLALPASAKPLRTPAASRMASRAPSIRSVNTIGRAPSIAPTLPDGAERMLESLRPEGQGAEDEYDDEVEQETPQFVLGSDDVEDKYGSEHHEHHHGEHLHHPQQPAQATQAPAPALAHAQSAQAPTALAPPVITQAVPTHTQL